MFTVQNSQRLIQNSLTPEGQEKCKQIMFHLCRIIQNHNISPLQICMNYGKLDITLINIVNFTEMIRRLDPSLTSLDLQILFTIFDSQNQGQITFLQFKNQLISFYDQFIEFQKQQNQEMSLDIKLDFQNEIVIYFARECIKNRTDLKKLYNSFLSSPNSLGLQIEDFKKMILNVNSRLNDGQIQKAFEVFDLQQDNIISYKEFSTTINRFTPKNIGIYRIIQEIRRHNIDLQLFFNNFNKDDNDIIDITEFDRMVKRIINDLSDQATELLFRKFDYKGERKFLFMRFKDVVSKYFFEDTVPDMKTEAAIAKLVKEIKINNYDPQQLFNNYDRSKDTKLDLFEFGILLRQIDQSLNEKEVQLAFQKFDIDNDQNVTLEEFTTTLQTFYQISVQPFENKNLAIFKLIDQITNSGINLQQLFLDMDVSGDKQLDIFEFGTILTKIDNTLSQQDIELAFEEFDLDGDRNISFEEFQETVQKLSEESKKQLTKSKQAIKKIVDMIKSLNLDAKQLFENFDVNSDGVLNGVEFIQMMKGYDDQLTESELQDAFYEFDSDRDGNVTLNEFINCLQKYYLI